ncbi:MAG: phage/plasmid primase, P4 family [Methylococcales bacterium]|nr:phage/plasmid primase, P4 family [Methylococcales bacterium]MDD5754370.1 phage/plasmid primase, P4 family [Methylococcales bacterium]
MNTKNNSVHETFDDTIYKTKTAAEGDAVFRYGFDCVTVKVKGGWKLEPAPLSSQLNEFKTPEQAKALATAALLENIGNVNLKQVCKDLGWIESDESHYPKQKHIKVAIVDTLIKTAKKHNWHIIHNEGFFYIFNSAFWVALQDSEVKQLLKNAAIKMKHLEIECRDVLFVDKLFQQATQDGFFAERNLKKQSIINLKNGSLVLDERGATLKPFDYRDFLTHQLDFDHTPDAVNNQFQQYLDDVLPNKDTQKTLQQVAGYLFIKGLKLELTFFLYGTGANGKSVFFEIINGVIGSENISNYSLESLTDEKGYHRAMIKDKIVNYGTDIRLTKIDAGMFKTLSSGEPIDARLPYRDPFTMTDYAKLIFNVNKMDSANVEHTHGFFRRFLIIPFNETIPELLQDKDLHKKILTDRAGVLNWMIEGAKEVVKNRKIFVSAECDQFKKQLMKETDSVAMFEEQFIKENLRGTFYTETVTNSYLEYKQYCLDAGFKALGRNNFSKRMQAIGFTNTKLDIGIALQKKFF